MNPSIFDYFRSFYYNNTYVDVVDINKNLSNYSCSDQGVREKAKKIFSKSAVREAFSSPLSYSREEIEKKNSIFTKAGFQLLGSKSFSSGEEIPYYSVLTHPDLPEWVLKSGGARAPADAPMKGPSNDYNETTHYTQFESLLRLPMNERIRQVAQEEKIPVIVPKEYLVEHPGNEDKELTHRYFVISERIDVLSVDETIQAIHAMSSKEQIELANKISTLIEKIGYCDASFDNIRLSKKGHQIVFLDTEPGGLYQNGERGYSIEKCARIGLYRLREFSKGAGLEGFAKAVDGRYQSALSQKSIWRIVLSIVCPLIPLVLLVISIYKTYTLPQAPSRQYFSAIEGVPFVA